MNNKIKSILLVCALSMCIPTHSENLKEVIKKAFKETLYDEKVYKKAFKGMIVASIIFAPIAICTAISQASQIKKLLFGDGYYTIHKNYSIKENFTNVAGIEHVIEDVKDVTQYMKNPHKFRNIGAKPIRGILFEGPPGNGKTLLAKAVAKEAGCSIIVVKGSAFQHMFIGSGTKRVQHIFDLARLHAPCIIFIDEIDAIGRKRSNDNCGINQIDDKLLNELLIQMDGFQDNNNNNKPIVVIGSTNRIGVLDPALLRAGRFDRKVYIGLPDEQARKKILQVHIKNIKYRNINLENIARKTNGFSGADLANLVNEAALHALKNNQNLVTTENFEYACDKLIQEHEHLITSSSFFKVINSQSLEKDFSSIAGHDNIKEEVKDIVTSIKQRETFQKFGIKVPKGILLEGPPGTGKTLIARTLAKEANCTFISVTGSEFNDMYIGNGKERVKQVFDVARQRGPAIIFIDEIDAIGSKRHDKSFTEVLNQLLAEMDGFNQSDKPVIVVAATNRADALDPALLRAGRFDRKVYVGMPDMKSRKEILEVHIKKITTQDIDLDTIARGTPGFSGADIANLVNEAALHALKNNQEVVTIKNFDAAREKILYGKKNLSIQQSQQELKTTAFHEAGHALMNLLQPEYTQPLHKVTITPHQRALGFSASLPERDQHSINKEELQAKLVVYLGGHAAEELTFNTVTTGASNDFEQATKIAYNMVCKYGMSPLGRIAFTNSHGEHNFLSQAMAEKIDHEVQVILNNAYAQTQKLLVDNQDKLQKLAQALLEHETLYAKDIYELLAIEPRILHQIA